ncbi:MAG: hypothetical protein ACOH5I_14520 [Oligoflexus sp.]
MSQNIKIIQRSLESSKTFDQNFAHLGPKILHEKQLEGLIPASLLPTVINYAQCMQSNFWLAEVEGKLVGRIGANILPSHPEQGGVGFFLLDRCHPQAIEVSQSLIASACQWLKSRNARIAYGPIDLHTWFPYRYPLPQQECNTSFDWEPKDPDLYIELWQQAGFQPALSFISQAHAALEQLYQHTAAAVPKLESLGYRFTLKEMTNLDKNDFRMVYQLSMDGFRDNPLFEPIPEEFFINLYQSRGKAPRHGRIVIATDKNNQAVSFFFGFADGEYVVLKSVATAKKHRGLGLNNACCHLFLRKYLEEGFTKNITALIRQGNATESFNRKGSYLWTREYVLLSKNLEK